MHICYSLNKGEDLQKTYEADRRKQMDLLLPSYINMSENGIYLRNLLAEIAGFSIIERATAANTQDFRSTSEIEELWDIMCARVIDLITDTVEKIGDPKILLMVKESVSLFMQTIQVR
jgi:exocyst complex component 6